jgi:hypothetical protein
LFLEGFIISIPTYYIFKEALYESKPPWSGSGCPVEEHLTSGHEAFGFIPVPKQTRKQN